MLAVIWKILSTLGLVLLILLGFVVFSLLLLLFMPVVYRLRVQRDAESLQAQVKIRWLFGFVRASYHYPHPGSVVIKVLWITLYDSGKASLRNHDDNVKSTLKQTSDDVTSLSMDVTRRTEVDVDEVHPSSAKEEIVTESAGKGMKKKLFAKYEKIKYTIKQIYVKIRHIGENIVFYQELIRDEDTKQLISHGCKRLGNILRNIRPRKLNADITFGTGEPDTTGYAYAVYGMFSAWLGEKVLVTPDFTQKIMVGNISAAGHLTVFILLVDVLAVLFDKRLRLLKHRLSNRSVTQK